MTSRGFGEWSGERWNHLQEIVEQFEDDCGETFPRDLEPYLPEDDPAFRLAVLEELVRTDLELRWRRRKPVRLEDYLERFPELYELPGLASLLREEYDVRQRFGDKPDFDEYRERFPDLYQQFQVPPDQAASDEEPTVPKLDPPLPVTPSDSASESEADMELGPGPTDEADHGLFPISGQYRRGRRIGKGSFGVVWEAQGPGGVPVAIKRLNAHISPAAMERERKSLDLICSGKLRHPFLLQVFGWWMRDDRLHIVMELADESLEDCLEDAKKAGLSGIPAEDLRQIMLDAGAALDFLNHERSILHRDIKPANMLLMANRLKLADFGLSRMCERLTLQGGRTLGAGTPIFMAPEVLQGEMSKHSDQYSLGATYHYLRTGRSVFSGPLTIMREQIVSEPPKLDDDILSDAEKAVLRRCLEKRPDQRFANNTRFVNALVASIESGPTSLGTRAAASKKEESEPSAVSIAAEQPSAERDSAVIEPEGGSASLTDETSLESSVPHRNAASSDSESDQNESHWRHLREAIAADPPNRDLRTSSPSFWESSRGVLAVLCIVALFVLVSSVAWWVSVAR